eukprot:SAG31_NODE_45491_length_258_cov_1.289308_1_plen_37_part_10
MFRNGWRAHSAAAGCSQVVVALQLLWGLLQAEVQITI